MINWTLFTLQYCKVKLYYNSYDVIISYTPWTIEHLGIRGCHPVNYYGFRKWFVVCSGLGQETGCSDHGILFLTSLCRQTPWWYLTFTYYRFLALPLHIITRKKSPLSAFHNSHMFLNLAVYVIYFHFAVDYAGFQRKFSFIYVLSLPCACCLQCMEQNCI